MKLNKTSLKNIKDWEAVHVVLPQFDIDKMQTATLENPRWIHFGAGNIFRGFIARLQQELLNAGETDYGVIAAEGFDMEIIDRIYKPYDNLSLLIDLKPDGSHRREIVASVAGSIRADFCDSHKAERLKDIFRSPSLQMASFTITEKGYAIYGMEGELTPAAAGDMQKGPNKPVHIMSVLTALMLERYKAGRAPLALVSMDNCSKNGARLNGSVTAIAKAWVENGYADPGFLGYLADPGKVSFPWTMIDKIVPRPSENISEQLIKDGIEDMAPVLTGKNTYIAPFINAEVSEYLVIEDAFPNGRPPLEKAGVYFADRSTVNSAERMKVTACLNPLHTALAVFGCLLGYTKISDEMKDSDLINLVERIGYDEGLPVVSDPKIIDPEEFIREVITERLPNPHIPDSPQRIATDTSQKTAIRFGETIKAYLARDDMDASGLVGIPLAIAGWLRYLLAIDDEGNPFEVSADPMLPQLQEQLKGIVFGDPASCKRQLVPILSNPALFAADLMESGLGTKIEGMFIGMLSGRGAVRNTLRKYNGMQSET